MYIDHLHQSSLERWVGPRLDIGPFSRIGSVFNVVVCAAIGAGSLWTGVTGQAPAYFVVIFTGVLEVIFVRVCVRAFRGDFDDFVHDSLDVDGDDPDAAP